MRARSFLWWVGTIVAPLLVTGSARGQGLIVPGPAPSAAVVPQPPPPSPPAPTSAPGAPPPPAPTSAPGAPPGPPPDAPPPGYVLLPLVPPGGDPGGRPSDAPATQVPVAEGTRGETQRVRFGPHVNIFSPNALFGVGASGQVHRLLEVMFDVGYLQAGSTEQSAAATAEATVRLVTPMLRGRLWPMNRHNLIVDLGAGVSFAKLTANGRNRDASESLDYERTGTPGIVAAGIGYGYRAPGPLRFAIVLGRQLMFGKMNDSKLTATSEFSPTDRAELKADLDRASKEIAELNVTYLQVTLGLLF